MIYSKFGQNRQNETHRNFGFGIVFGGALPRTADRHRTATATRCTKLFTDDADEEHVRHELAAFDVPVSGRNGIRRWNEQPLPSHDVGKHVDAFTS